jgi:DNA-directed RNA polymerase subunit H (RpoH/RPB5)
MHQFEKYQILSSDEEEETFIEFSIESYQSPTKSIQADEEFVNAILKTPGTVVTIEESNPIISDTPSRSPELYKEECFEELSNRTPSPSKPMPISSIKENTEGETVTILEIRQENEAEEFLKNEFPVFQGPGGSDHEKSALKLLDNSEHHDNLLKSITQELNEAIAKEIVHDNKITHVKTQTTNNMTMNPKQQCSYPPPLKATHYVSVAEAVRKFHKDTPERFHSLPRGRGNAPVMKTQTGFFPLKPTVPHPFHFSMTKQRPVVSNNNCQEKKIVKKLNPI